MGVEVCSNCGKFVESLNDKSGWCDECHRTTLETGATELIEQRVEQYLAANADEIEFHLFSGVSLWQAIDAVHNSNHRPKCLVCGNPITRAKRTAIFCRRYSICRRYSRKYVYLYRERGLSKSQALEVILKELT